MVELNGIQSVSNFKNAAANAVNATQNASASKAAKTVGELIQKADNQQQQSDMSIKELLSGKSSDIHSVVAEVARADMSFKLLVGVRNKLVEAYKQTMNMPI